MRSYAGIDSEIRTLVQLLNEVGIETDWSCSGGPGHMVLRPTIQARTSPFPQWEELQAQKRRIEQVMAQLGIEEYWLSLVFTYGRLNTHGGEPTWLLQIPGRYDWLALPVAYDMTHRSFPEPESESAQQHSNECDCAHR